MKSLVRLETPYTRGGVAASQHQLPLKRGPRWVRTGGRGRWHRPRSGVQFTADAVLGARVCFSFWCGQSAQGAGLLTAAVLPVGEPVC